MLAQLKMGQVVFHFDRDKGRLEPLRVVEELSRKTLGGTETIYMVQFPGSVEPVSLSTLKVADVFPSIDDAHRVMSERSNMAIRSLIDAATKRASEFFPDASLEPSTMSGSGMTEMVAEEGDEQVMEVDGQLVKVRSVSLPDALKY